MKDIGGCELHPFFQENNMACPCNYPTRFRATEIAVAAGVTTITIPATPVINPGDIIDVLLYTAIPEGTDGTELIITNGTISEPVLAFNGNYYRPLPLRSRTILRMQYLDDPGHFQLIGIRR